MVASTETATDVDSSTDVRLSSGGHWYCELCGRATPPLLGKLGRSLGFGPMGRHHCRLCGQTVCGECSMLKQGARTCRKCCLEEAGSLEKQAPREKFVFLVRHAQSTWNQQVDMFKTVRNVLHDISLKDVVSGATGLLTEMWDRDHPLSDEGGRQTMQLRRKVAQLRDRRNNESCGPSERVQRFYDQFLAQRPCVYSSPLLRALQTAQLTFPEEDGWGPIRLLKDARERFSFIFERDCLGTGVGMDIVKRAVRMCNELHGLDHRVDINDCGEMWWSEEIEHDKEVEARLNTLWQRLLNEDEESSCLLVTHSNVIRTLLMQFGSIDNHEESQSTTQHRAVHCPNTADGHDVNLSTVDTNVAFANPFEKCDEHQSAAWEFVGNSSETLHKGKIDKLENCGVLGLRCVCEVPPNIFPEADGWIDIDTRACRDLALSSGVEPQWVAKDALLMFDSVLVS